MASVNLSVEGRSALAAAIPTEKRFWDWTAMLDDVFNRAYWRASNYRWIPEDQRVEAIEHFLSYNYPIRALDVLFRLKCDDEMSINYEIVIRALDSFLTVNEEFDRSHYSYVVSQLLKWLEMVAPSDSRLPLLEFLYFDFVGFEHDPSNVLYRLLGSVPDEFVSLVELIYRGQGWEGKECTAANAAFADLSRSVLFHWGILPGLREGGEIDGDHLSRWVSQCRALFCEHGDVKLGDREIGAVLASSPEGRDGIWPAEEVRMVIESLKNEDVEAGLMTGRYNRWGVSVRPVYDGGSYERSQAQKCRNSARQLAIRWSRTSRVLRQMADDYERDADHLDKRDEQLADE
jgi:conserved hypothetical protein